MRTTQSSLEPPSTAYGFVNRRSTVQSRPPAQEDTKKTEEWRQVPGFSWYRVSDLGRVMRFRNERQLHPTGRNGYLSLNLRDDARKLRRVAVHRLVAAAFIGPCPPGKEVDHLDGVKSHNAATNLEYVTHAENLRRARERSPRSAPTCRVCGASGHNRATCPVLPRAVAA